MTNPYKTDKQNLKRYFYTSLALILVFATLSVYLLQRSFEAAKWIEHRRQIQNELDGVRSCIFEMEAAQRGFFLTKDPDVSDHLGKAKAELFEHIERSSNLVENETEKNSLDFLKGIVDSRVSLIEEVDSIFNSRGIVTQGAREKIMSGDELMDQVRAITINLSEKEEALLQRRISDLSLQRGFVYTSILLFVIISIVVTTSGFIQLKRDRNALISASDEKVELIEELEQSEQRYRSLNASSHDGIIVTDDHGKILSWNKSATRIFGYEKDEVIGQPLDKVIPDYGQGQIGATIAEVIRTEGSDLLGEQAQVPGRRKDGSSFSAELTLATWKEGDDRYFSGNVRDISKQVELREQLNQTVSELERSNQELEQFAYIASHDLQEPLRKIRAFSDRLITKMEAPEENKEKLVDYAERMARAAERMQGLIQDLLAFSRVSRNVGERNSVDLQMVVAAVIEDLEYLITENGGVVEFDDLPILQSASRTQLYQLFQNLVSNAIKFHSPDRIPKVKVTYKVMSSTEVKALGFRAKKQDYHRIDFSDNGIGFDEKYIDKIFAIFQRLHDRSVFKGSGIGLAMCRRICENHNGFISASSTEGEGSVFTLLLPKK